jgi:hypothetical protein
LSILTFLVLPEYSSPVDSNSDTVYGLLELFLAQRGGDSPLEFEDWVIDYPDQAEALRQAWGDWQRASDELEASPAGDDGEHEHQSPVLDETQSLADRLEARFGLDADPHISLAGGEASDPSLSLPEPLFLVRAHAPGVRD